jgi:hypothetical protein
MNFVRLWLLTIATAAGVVWSYSGSAQVTVTRTVSPLSAKYGDTILITENVAVGSISGTSLRGFYLTDYIPGGYSVAKDSLWLGNTLMNGKIKRESLTDQANYPGFGQERWVFETPTGFTENNPIAPQTTVVLKYRLVVPVNATTGTITLPGFSWVAMDPTQGDAGDVYGYEETPPTLSITGSPTPVKIAIASATASSYQGGNTAAAAIDADLGSRWESAFTDNEWIYFDLGKQYTVRSVVFVWENASGKTYKVQGSNDASFAAPIDLYSYTAAACGAKTDSLPIAAGGAFRYVRMLGQTRCTGYGYSIFDARIYGSQGSQSTPPTVAAAAAATPSPVTGTSATLSVLGADDGGEAALTYSWTSSGPAAVAFSSSGTNAAKNSTATFTKAGSYTITATIKDGDNQTVASSVNVTVNQTATTLALAPATASVAINATQQFTATANDQFGVALATQPTVTWTVSGGGSIGTTGLFTAGTTAGGPYTVTATTGSLNATSTVTVTAPNNAPTIATSATATPNPVTGTTATLGVLGADDGGEAALSYTWSATGPATVSYSVNGTNAAKSSIATFTKAGSYTITATIKDAQGAVVTSAVTVTVNQSLTTIVVVPANATVALNATQQFTATANDQFGIALATQPTFTWTVSGGGNIAASGLFTAATAGGPYTVKAASGSVNGTANATVTTTVTLTRLTIATATASSVENGGTPVSGAIDGNATTRWASEFTDNEWITFDLGSPGTVKVVVLVWETASGKTYKIQGSNDAAFGTSTDLYSYTAAACGAKTDSLVLTTTGSFRYVRMLGQTRCTGYGYSIYEARIYGSSAPLSAPPTIATAAAASPNPVTGTTATLSVLGADDGGEPALTYTWAATGPAAVSFSANGTNAAKNTVATFTKAGNYTVTATVKDGDNQTVNGSLTVTVNQTATAVAVTPATATVAITAAQQYTATAKDQFGTALSTQPAFTWTVSGGGTINAAGLFTAGTTAGGPYTVTATTGSLNAIGSVTVVATVQSSKLSIVSATASSIENGGTPVAAAIDGNMGTRWSSGFTDNEWISFDLGAAKTVTNVVLSWENASGKTYKIQGSNDAGFTTSTDLYSYTAAACGAKTDSLTISNTGAFRYIRMLGQTRCTGYGYSIYEATVYGY